MSAVSRIILPAGVRLPADVVLLRKAGEQQQERADDKTLKLTAGLLAGGLFQGGLRWNGPLTASGFLSDCATLTTALSLAASDTTTQTALQTSTDKYIPALIESAKGLLSGGFNITAVFTLAGEAVTAAQEWKGIVARQDRAAVAQVELVVAAKAALPDMVEPWMIPLLFGDGVKALIESPFLKIFGPDKLAAPAAPVIPLDDDTLGRPATNADCAPSMVNQ